MKYKYTGITRNQDPVVGVVEAKDEAEAKLRLRAMQIRPLVIKIKSEDKALDNIFSRPAIDLKGMMIFTRQFSSLIDSGIPVVQCLDILGQQEKRPAFKKILEKVKQDVEAGLGLAESFSRHPKTFSEFFIRILEAGEVSGTLDTSLKRIGVQLERLGRLKAKVIGAMLYPMVTIVVAIGVLIFLLVKVVPEISKLYSEGNAQLPDLTVFVLGISAWLQLYYGYVLFGLVAAGMMVPIIYRLESFREVWDPFLLKIPGFGDLVKKAAIARFTRTLSTLVSSGVPLLNSFDICSKLISNLRIKSIIKNAMSFITEGKSMAQGLNQHKIFPPMVIHMVSIGEMTGKLDELLGKVADIYDDEVDDAVNTLTGLIQPALIVGVGAVIAFLLLAMYLPIFQLAEKVTG